MDQKEEIAQQTIIEDEPKISLAEKLKEKKKLQRKKIIKRSIWAVVALFFAYVIWWGFKPRKASAEYGICSTILELHVPYPHTLYISEMNIKREGTMEIKRDGPLEIWYTHTDAFGEYRMEPLLCRVEYLPDPQTGINAPKITELRFNKVTVDPDRLAFLNNAMPYFVKNPLIKNYPRRLPDSLSSLKVESDMFRRFKIDSNKKAY